MRRKVFLPPAAAFSACLLLALLGCESAPKPNLALDLAGVQTPVMLSPVEDAGKSLSVSFESGYASQSVTATASSGGMSASTTVTVSRDLRRPLRDQLMPTLLQDPDWLAVDSLVLRVEKVLGPGFSSREYLLVLGLRAPLGK